MSDQQLFAWFLLGGFFILCLAGLFVIYSSSVIELEASELHGFSSPSPAGGATGSGPSRSSSLPGVEQRDRVFDQDRMPDNGAPTPDLAAEGGEGSFGEVRSRTHLHSLALIRSYVVVIRGERSVCWRWRCSCGVKIHGFDSEAECVESFKRHREIEDSIETFAPGGVS